MSEKQNSDVSVTGRDLPKALEPLLTPAAGTGMATGVRVGVPVEKLSPEEQMALFEEKLKEEDWGHQPC